LSPVDFETRQPNNGITGVWKTREIHLREIEKFDLVKPGHPQAEDHKIKTSRDALILLKKAALSKATMKRLAILREGFLPNRKDKTRPTDRKILDDLAKMMAKGSVRIKKLKVATGGSGGSTPSPPSPSPSSSRALRTTWPSGPRMRIRERPDPKPKAPPEPPVNTAQQIAALKSAAKSGAPFCEQCNG